MSVEINVERNSFKLNRFQVSVVNLNSQYFREHTINGKLRLLWLSVEFYGLFYDVHLYFICLCRAFPEHNFFNALLLLVEHFRDLRDYSPM